MRRAVLLCLLCVVLAGCGGTRVPSVMLGSGSTSPEVNVRAVIPALEAYYADNGTYHGVRLKKLRSTYDPELVGVRFVVADARTYCVESTTPGEPWSKHGPATDIVPGPC